MNLRHALPASIVFALSIAVSVSASASAVGVSPLRLSLKQGQQTTGIYLTNANDEAGPYQIQVMKWTQVDGQDIYKPAESMVSSPAIITVEGHTRQIVRILETRPVAPGSAYRVLVKQLPTPAMLKKGGLTYLLTISLPLFVDPAPGAHAQLSWKQADGCHWTITNTGDAVARITAVSVNGQTVVPGLLGYVLPHSYLSFAPATCHASGNINASVNGQPASFAE